MSEESNTLYQKRIPIYPRSVKGRFRTLKTGILVLAYAVYFLLPWLRWERPNAPNKAVLYDLPGTMGSDGVIATISSLDYLFVPIKADRLVLESTLNFATTINDRLIKTGVSALKSLHLFWNMVDRRERTTLYDVYQQGFSLLGLDCLKTRIPVRSNFTKDLSATGGSVYRSTLFAPDAAFTKECGFDTFMDEIISVLKTE